MTLMTVNHTNDETEKAFIYIGHINIYIFNVCLWLTGTHYQLFVFCFVFKIWRFIFKLCQLCFLSAILLSTKFAKVVFYLTP